VIIDFILFGFLFYLTIPLIAGYSAKCYGRSFWRWFALGAIFPGFAHMLLAFIIQDRSTALTEKENDYMTDQIERVLQEIQLR